MKTVEQKPKDRMVPTEAEKAMMDNVGLPWPTEVKKVETESNVTAPVEADWAAMTMGIP